MATVMRCGGAHRALTITVIQAALGWDGRDLPPANELQYASMSEASSSAADGALSGVRGGGVSRGSAGGVPAGPLSASWRSAVETDTRSGPLRARNATAARPLLLQTQVARSSESVSASSSACPAARSAWRAATPRLCATLTRSGGRRARQASIVSRRFAPFQITAGLAEGVR
jgi:hypothetical protein